ncbi:MAG: hypothetical protein AAB071_04250 [Bacteroidota bacterium]
MQAQTKKFEPEQFYHIYNRANGSERLFVNEGNYTYFLQKYAEYIHPFAETFAYCLLPNHFHFLIRVRSFEELKQWINLQGLGDLEGLFSKTLSQQWSNFFNAYTKAFNTQQNRRGNLFQHNFKRICITNDRYLCQLIYYIHCNPLHHRIATSIDEWKYSSYHAMKSKKDTLLARAEVLEIFGGKEKFIAYHSQSEEHYTNLQGLRDLEGLAI